ncbi:hypothetical protein J1614_007489 [Plenodomus biglobosus]|nr:hypothetical protein J1614_007489 [Plenodomus biglobosus]
MPAVISIPIPGIYSLPDFYPALTQHAILTTNHEALPATFVINIMLNLSTYLISISSHGNFFGPRDTSSYNPNLRVLHARLLNGYVAPPQLPSQFQTPAHIEQSTRAHVFRGNVHQRHLADFQDLYYALLARIREMQQRMSDHLRSGFSTPDTELFPSGPTLANLHGVLSLHWDLLNGAATGKAMDAAIREARVQCIQDEIVAQVAGNILSAEEAEVQITQLREKHVYEAQPGLEWTPEWDAALVNAKLGEKYRNVFEECRKRYKKEGGKSKALQKMKMEFEREQAEERGAPYNGGEVKDIKEVLEDGFVETEAEIDREEQEWLWQVEQMQHPAFRDGFSIDAPLVDLELFNANASQIHHVLSIQSTEQIEVAQPVQQLHHQQMQPDGPASATQQGINNEEVALIEEHVAWHRKLEAQRQRVSQYTTYLRGRASAQASSMVGSARQSRSQGSN